MSFRKFQNEVFREFANNSDAEVWATKYYNENAFSNPETLYSYCCSGYRNLKSSFEPIILINVLAPMQNGY